MQVLKSTFGIQKISLRDTFANWHGNALWQSHKKAILQKALLRMRFLAMSMAFNAWVRSIKKAKMVERAMLALRHHLLWKAWRSFKKHHNLVMTTKAIQKHRRVLCTR